MRVVFAGGGTGGHLYPGLAIARALVKLDPAVRPFFVGAHRGIERDVLPTTGFPYLLLDLHPLYRARPWENWRTLRGLASAWRGIGRFRGESSFRTWLVGIAINVARTHRGRMARLRRIFADRSPGAEPGDDPPERAAMDDGIETTLVQRDAIDRALAELPEEMREAVVLRDLHGLEYREIADALGIPVGTVESRIFRGRQRLRPLLQALRGR